MTKPKTRAPIGTGATFQTVRTLALALPGVEEGTSYGTPSFKVGGGKLLARLREDGETLVVRVDPDARDLLMRSDPKTFFITDHYEAHPLMLVQLSRVKETLLAELLAEAWRLAAPKRLASRGLGAPAPPAGKPAIAPPKAGRRAKKAPTTPAGALSRVREICLALPEASESENHSRPCFEVGGKTFVMFMDNHHGDGRLAIWCKAPPGVQSMLVGSDPERFFVPPYVGPRGWIGARLEAGADWSLIAASVEESYRMTAPKRVLARL